MQGKQKIHAILVGCGSMSGAWLDAAVQHPDVEVVGLVDIVEDAARRRAVEFHLPHALIGTNVVTVLERCHPDLVFNCTPPEAHVEVGLAGFEYGCHVLSEKPLADSMEHAHMLLEAARKNGTVFAVMQNRRFDPNIRRVASFLSSDTIGTLTTVNSDFYIGAHFGGFRDHMQHVLLMDMAIHTFDAARYLMRADPISVYCKEWNPIGSWYEHDASAIAIFEMSNGVVYTYRGSWCANSLPTTWEGDWRFIGQDGSVKWDGANQMQAQVVAGTEGFIRPYRDVEIPSFNDQTYGFGHRGLINEFIECLKAGCTPETNAEDNLKSLAMVFGAIESAKKGQKVGITYERSAE